MELLNYKRKSKQKNQLLMDKNSNIDIINNKLTEFNLAFLDSDQNPIIEIDQVELSNVCKILKTDSDLDYSMLIDVCAVDYLTYGEADWTTNDATNSGYSRAVKQTIIPEADETFTKRFAVFYQLLSLSYNKRLTLKVFTTESNPPSVPSINKIWNSANWFEREAFDLMGIHFKNHPDLRRILTDYGFIGHPFRKDFPTNGNLEVVYDEDEERVIYRPVSISTRPSVPKVIRDKNDGK
jgi:NADH-quinone oxidoreductase subunit C